MRPEAAPWLRQAEADLEAAQDSVLTGHYEWACFQCQQAAEKPFKAFLWEKTGRHPGRHHTLFDPGGGGLLEACQEWETGFSALATAASLLRQQESPTRYPDATTSPLGVAPVDRYQARDAEECLVEARSIVNFVTTLLNV